MTSLLVIVAALSAAPKPDADALEHFEKKIRPVLVKHCYECHSAESKIVQANLYLDTRAGVLRGGDSGPSVVPGKPKESLLLAALKYDGYEMPPQGQLSEEVIADFAKRSRTKPTSTTSTPRFCTCSGSTTRNSPTVTPAAIIA